jgi:flavin reductase (DIM6/NTAB) family NADH-FMN oxidoreductase RutF
MAGDSAKRFAGSHWELDELGLPRIKGVRALLIARIIAVNEVGTNASVIIEIEDGKANLDCEPLVYVDRKFHAVGDVLVD